MSGLSEELRRFIDDPGAWALPHRAAAWIAPGLSAATAGQLLGSPRLAARTSALLAERLGRGDAAALAPDDALLAVANPPALAAVARSAGAIVHASRLRTLVMAADIAALEARIGAAARRSALRHEFAVAGATRTGDVAADILRDGQRCLAAWVDGLPPWAAARLRLKLEGAEAAWTGDDAPAGVRALRLAAQTVLEGPA